MKSKNITFLCAATALLLSAFENLQAQWQTLGDNIYYNNGNVGLGTASINNSQGYHKVLDIYGTRHAKLLVRGGVVKTEIFADETWIGMAGGIGTESMHDLRLVAGYNNVMT
ncbi:MAG: hypothetical protein LBV26_05895 [Bacteroidales bacterium]|jgi:hypothetical protein|nr:hypothetical protein [Bacteroidales bacterium]